MATVYADSPAQAFNVNADLDQRRVVNYLNSVAANRQAQLQSYGAFSQQAGAEQADQERQQAMMIGLAERAAQQRAQESSRQLEQQKWMDTLGLNKSQLEENIRHNKAIEEKPNASKEALDFKKAQLEAQTKQEDEYATHIADLLEKRRHLQGLLTQIPTDQPGRAAMVDRATGEGMQPEPVTFGQGLGNVLTLGLLTGRSKQTRKKFAEVKQNIKSIVSDLPVDFTKAESIADYADLAKKAIDARLMQIPDFKSALGIYITQDEHGHFVPILHGPATRNNGPTHAFHAMAGTPPEIDPEAPLSGLPAAVAAAQPAAPSQPSQPSIPTGRANPLLPLSAQMRAAMVGGSRSPAGSSMRKSVV